MSVSQYKMSIAWTFSDQSQYFRVHVFEKNAIFTAFYGFLRRFLEKIPTEFLVLCIVTKLWKIPFLRHFTVFYDFLRHEIMSNDVCLTWIFAWVCLGTKWVLFEHFLTRVTIFECMYLKNVIFTAFYGFLRHFLKKIPTEFLVLGIVTSV